MMKSHRHKCNEHGHCHPDNPFNAAHPFAAERERGWRPVPDPFMPRPPQKEYGHVTKHIFIQSDQLFYDIDAVTGLLDRASRSIHGTPEVATSESDTYRPMFFRWFDKYIGKAEECMSAFVLKLDGIAKMNLLKEWQEREIALLMPDYWDATVYDSLVQAVHQYIVSGALYEYFSITLSSKDPRTVDRREQLDEYYDMMRSLVCRVIPGSVHRHLKPF